MKLSRKELRTLFYVGRKLKLTHTLLGPVFADDFAQIQAERVVKSQHSFGYIMETPQGPSWLRFESGEIIDGEGNGNGFTHITIRSAEGEIAARYQLL